MSEVIDGGLGFRVTLDIDDFKVSAEAMERNIKSMSDSAVKEYARVEQSILSFAQNGARYIVSYLVGNGMAQLVDSIVQTRGQFQQLELAFETMLQSEIKAKDLMDQMIDTAAKTPFDLAGVAGGAKQLLAYGTAAEEVNDTLIRLGNIASGLSIPLNDIVYLYGTTMVQGRLYAQDVRQFTGRGIPLVKELAAMYGKTTEEISAMVSEGKIGFADVEKVILKMTNAGGQFYDLMQKQSSSLTGMIANLGDAWDMALNKIGADNQKVFAAGIDSATYMVEHLDDILRIVKAITVSYGSYKAAVVVNTLATKGYTGISLIDNTVRQAKIALVRAGSKLSGEEIALTKKMEAAEKAHTAALMEKITIEQHEQALLRIKTGAINDILSAQQKRYLSNKSLVSGSKEYIQKAESILTREQKMILSKQDLTTKSRAYSALIEDIAKKNEKNISSLKDEAKELEKKINFATQLKGSILQEAEAARYQLYWAKQSNDLRSIENAERKLLSVTKRVESVNTDINTASIRKEKIEKELSTIATKKQTAAGVADNLVTDTQIAKKSLLSTVTAGLTVKLKALWTTMLANPLTALISVVGLAISSFTLFGKKKEEVTDVAKEFEAQTKREIDSVRVLTNIVNTANSGTKARKEAIEKLNRILEGYNLELLKESATVDEVSKRYKELTKSIKESTAERLKAQGLEDLQNKKAEQDKGAFDAFKSNIGGIRDHQTMSGGTAGTYSVTSIPEWVQEMDAQVYEFLETHITESAQNIASLTGAEYQKAYQDLKDKTLETLKRTTGATDEELSKASGYVDKFINHHLESIRELSEESTKITEKMEAAGAIWAIPPETVLIDYMTHSFSELDDIAKNTLEEINKINEQPIKVDADNSRLLELLDLLGKVQSAIRTKEADLNTESGINNRIKDLQDERANVAINSDEYKNLTATITDLQKKLSSNNKNSGEDAIRKQEQLAEKQIQADIKLEQARIEIMEDSYAKRKAQLDLQHKISLADIDKEQKDLERARREAGSGGLNSDEVQSFSDRRDLESKSYIREQNKLFDGEIEYKKNQYQLYFRWVKNMGKDVADTQFSNLLKDGTSYKDYVEKQIQELKQKQTSGSLTEGEGNHLIALNMQYDEITGAKSAMDSFKESVTLAITQASTLAEKMKAIADAKKRLADGGNGLLGEDEKAEAALFISDQDIDIQKELQNTIIKDFKTFEEQKRSIQKEYNLLRMEAIKQGNDEALKEINRGEAEALSKLNAQMLMQTDEWKNLFANLDILTAKEIKNLVENVNSRMAELSLTMDPADLKAILDRLQEAEQKIIEKNPFKALSGSYTKMVEAFKDLEKVKQDGLSEEELKNFERVAIQSAQNVANAIDGINDMLGVVSTSLSKLASSLGKDELANDISSVMEMVNGLGETAGGVAKLMAGDIVGGIKGVVSGIADTVSSIFNRKDKKAEKNIQEMQDEVEKLQKSYERLGRAIEKTYSNKVYSLMDQQRANLEDQRKKIEDQIKAESGKKKTDDGKIKEWENQLISIDNAIEDSLQKQMEMLAGTDVKSAIDEFADALVDAYSRGEDAAEALGEVTKRTMANAVKGALKKQFLADEIDKAVSQLAIAMEDGILTDEEQADFSTIVNSAGDKFSKALEAYKLLFQDFDTEEGQDPLKGAVRSLSEETGGVIAGRLNAIVINQTHQTAVLRESLLYQQEIAANTRYNKNLEGILSVLQTIESKNSLLPLGVS